MPPECAACDAPIDKRAVKCEACGNQPRKDFALALVAIALAVAVGSIFFPPAIALSVIALFIAALVWVTARWLYPARKYDFDFSGLTGSASGDSGEEQSAD